MTRNLRSYDVLGNIAILKFNRGDSLSIKKKRAKKILEENKGVRTVLEKSDKIKGRLRKATTKYIAGENTKEVLYKENGCVFRFNVDSSYFSPRLSNERKEISSLISKGKKGNCILVMFAGVAPYSIVIAKNCKNVKVVSVELNKEANNYAEMNVLRNKLKDKVEVVRGDVKRVIPTFVKQKRKFDYIVMPRPQLKEDFLKEAFAVSKSGKNGTKIFYYDFCSADMVSEVVNKIKQRARESKVKIKILKTKVAGEIGNKRIRLRVDMQVT